MREPLLEPDSAVPPCRRRSNAVRLTGSILVAGLVAGLVNLGIGEEADPVPAPRWTAAVATEFGEPLLARSSGDRIVVTAETGVVALDAETGKQRWSRAFDADDLEIFKGRLNGLIAQAVTTVVGDVVGMTRWRQSKTRILQGTPSKVTVWDLRTGRERFSIEFEADTEMTGSVTPDTLAVRQCPDGFDPDCTLTGYRLADGETAWMLDREFERHDLALPAPLRNNLQTGQIGVGNWALSPGVVPQRSFAVLSEFGTDDYTHTRVTSIDLVTGELALWTDQVEE